MAVTFSDVCAVVPAAGFGRRMQTECPKQYLSIGDKTILEHSVAALLAHPRVTRRHRHQPRRCAFCATAAGKSSADYRC
jgi:CTP:molybdopterin cytidylyltransferase MocA